VRIIKNIPTVALQQAIHNLLSKGQDKAVYGEVPESVTFPYITIDAITAKPLDTKNSMQWNCSLTVNIWGVNDGKGKKAVYETVSDITYLISKYGTLVVIDGFAVLDAQIDLIETFPEQTTGYHGLIQINYSLSDKEE
jgi:hypothetical protein